ncbi:MAG: aspartate kinase [Chloracidobacterium sp.]|nr:aspartate kinase [Chloracidobacterium sp.]MDW8217510.1 aspartate kinase [Acidobacteriota bacterium]
MRVLKFGGTSVGDADRIRQLVSIVNAEREQDARIVVVVSAMAGVTNRLLDAARSAACGNVAAVADAHAELRRRHLDALTQLVANDAERRTLTVELDAWLDRFARIGEGIALVGELPPRAQDFVAGLGERLSARLVAAALRASGVAATAYDADQLIVTDDTFGGAVPEMAATAAATRARLLPALAAGHTPVVTGFIGATPEGIPTTLGRGGSDYSAGILGAALEAEAVVIWTDADGFMTADPRLIPTAQVLAEISYAEASELAYYGAKVLHPKTLLPLIPKGIPLYVKNSFRPQAPGTRVSATTGDWRADIKSVTSIKGLALITVAGRGMLGVPGIAAKTFAAVAAAGVNVLLISQSSSENNLCLMVEATDAEKTRTALVKALAMEFHHGCVERVDVLQPVAIVAVVGAGMRGRPGIAARIFSAVAAANVNVIAIAQGSSEINISFVVTEEAAVAAVAAIHEQFALGVA